MSNTNTQTEANAVKATRKTYSKQLHTFIENGETINAVVYGGIYKLDEAQANIIIEDLGEGNEHGRYMLTLGNDGWMSDNLAELEAILFPWMESEGFEYDEEVK